MITLYVLASVTAALTAAIGCWPAALVFASVAVVLMFAAELRAGLRKIRRPAVTKQPALKR